MKQRKWNDDDCIKFAKLLQPGDDFFVEGQGFIDKLVQFGTGDNKGIYPGDDFDPNHVGIYIGEGQGKTIEADGEKVAWHLISDYFEKLKKGEVRIVVMRIKGLTVDELQRKKNCIKGMLGQKYNNTVNFWFGIWGLLRNIPVVGGGLGWLASKIRNPGYKANSPNCSIATCKANYAIDRVKQAIEKADGKPLENRTPENLFNAELKSGEFIVALDTLLL